MTALDRSLSVSSVQTENIRQGAIRCAPHSPDGAGSRNASTTVFSARVGWRRLV
jgi:hypothetical protein